jgi:hypothetical protein
LIRTSSLNRPMMAFSRLSILDILGRLSLYDKEQRAKCQTYVFPTIGQLSCL